MQVAIDVYPSESQRFSLSHLERRKKQIDDEYQREKKRQEIRDKYGIEKKQTGTKDKMKMINDMKKEYGMSDEDARELQQKMCQVYQHILLAKLGAY